MFRNLLNFKNQFLFWIKQFQANRAFHNYYQPTTVINQKQLLDQNASRWVRKTTKLKFHCYDFFNFSFSLNSAIPGKYVNHKGKSRHFTSPDELEEEMKNDAMKKKWVVWIVDIENVIF